MRIGIIGIGKIAQKAYLPTYSMLREQGTLIFATTNQQTKKRLINQYGFTHVCDTIDELIKQKITVCFVHAATKAHGTLIQKLLQASIHVFVDKPLSENFDEVKQLKRLAQQKNCLLMIGFNRRFAPFVEKLQAVPNKNLIILQKNRVAAVQSSAYAIYDLFLHLVDTAVYLLGDKNYQTESRIIEKNGQLQRAFLRLETATTTTLCSMNLFSGANSESYEIMSETGTYRLEDLTTLTVQNKTGCCQENFDDWATTLYKRGFETMVHHFLAAVKTNDETLIRQTGVITSHELCEKMLLQQQRHVL